MRIIVCNTLQRQKQQQCNTATHTLALNKFHFKKRDNFKILATNNNEILVFEKKGGGGHSWWIAGEGELEGRVSGSVASLC